MRATLLLAGVLLCAFAGAADAEDSAAPSARAFFASPQLSKAKLSPSGKHIAAILSVHGQEMIMVWSVDTNAKKPILRFPTQRIASSARAAMGAGSWSSRPASPGRRTPTSFFARAEK
jgi:hypothetical protein